jgi:hypothetical protein
VANWSRIGLEAFAAQDFMRAAGPFAGCVARDSTHVLGLKVLSICLTTYELVEPALDATRRYLALRPGDQEIESQLVKLEALRAR